MKKLNFLLMLIFIFQSNYGSAISLKINNFKPNPNFTFYGSERFQSITDGKVVNFPMLTKQGSVGWKSAYKVAIEFSVENPEMQIGEWSQLRLHVLKRLPGVKIPKRIDVYGGENKNKLHHIGNYLPKSQNFKNNEHHWLSLKVPYLGKHLVIVIQSSTSYIFLDEIEMFKYEKKKLSSVEISKIYQIGDVKKVILHAGNELKNSYLKKFQNSKSSNIKDLKSEYLLWPCDSYGDLTGELPDLKTINLENTVSTINYDGRRVECFGLFVKNKQQKVGLKIESSSKSKIDVYELLPVVAADGKVVYDPAVPIEIPTSLDFKNGELKYLIFDLPNVTDISKKDKTTISFKFDDSIVKKNISRIAQPPFPVELIQAFSWNYSHKLPIWKNKENALAQLIGSGINVFTIHYYNTPIMGFSKRNDTKGIFRFVEDVNRYKGKGKILINSDVYNEYSHLLSKNANRSDFLKLQAAYAEWLNNIVNILQREGVGFEDWAIFLVDEPNHAKYKTFRQLIAWTKKANSNVSIYANPSVNQRYYNKLYKLLEDDLNKVDYWQPRLEFAEANPGFFSSLNKVWWTYHNPPYPAKSANPLIHYRLPAWRTWLIGAKGVGVWAYDDSGSKGGVVGSNWNDFDGEIADYSTVYEHGEAVIPSRRWLAFSLGIQDLKFLHSLQKRGCNQKKMKVMVKQVVLNKNVKTEDINNLLEKLTVVCKEII